MIKKIKIFFNLTFIFLITIILFTRSVLLPSDSLELIRRSTRSVEFNYEWWTLQALSTTFTQSSLNWLRYITEDTARSIVFAYLEEVNKTEQLQSEISQIYADPDIRNPQAVAQAKLDELTECQKKKHELALVAESIIQMQVSEIIAREGLAFLGQPLPPVLYHVTELPLNLIVSPRDEIRQQASISLIPELDMEKIVGIENEVAANNHVSAMITPIGGVGVYPTMVGQTTSLSWLLETVAHEWIHNYLTLQPLGLGYESSPEMRTMNETTASIAGKEIGLLVLKAYYPEKVPQSAAPREEDSEKVSSSETPQPAVFDFNAEMRITRLEADRLLSMGKIEEAEAYMEARRLVFRDHGYQIRKLNQAYFAFYGAYADTPGGAAGEDPVGPAVRELRNQSDSLAAFVNAMAKMKNFADLQKSFIP